MRGKHGSGTKRNVKFDDEEEILYLHVCLPNDNYWHRISAAEAKSFRERLGSRRSVESRRVLEDESIPNTSTRRPTPGTSSNSKPLGQLGAGRASLLGNVEQSTTANTSGGGQNNREWPRREEGTYVTPKAKCEA